MDMSSDDLRFGDPILDRVPGLSYRSRREFLWHQMRPRLSRFLYKFRALEPSNGKSVDRIRDILVRSRLWFSSPVNLNDPFEMSVKVTVKGTIEEKQQRFREVLKQEGMKWKEQTRQMPCLVSMTSAEIGALAQAQLRGDFDLTGVCCFGGDPRSILMWSHYASNHEGFCLQFEVAEDFRAFGLAAPVDYVEEYPVVNWVTEFREGIRDTILRKYIGWKYECESRILLPERARQYVRFRPEALKGIIIGCRAKDATVAKLRALIAERSSLGFRMPTLYRAGLHEAKYKLVIKRFR